MKTCRLFGDQCFKRNMVYTVAQLRLGEFYKHDYGCYYSPSQSKIIWLTERLPNIAKWQHIETSIYYARAAQIQTSIYYARAAQIQTSERELRCCLSAFEN